jgi:hypothetical protein
MAADAIERPPNMPIGTYLWQVTKVPVQGEVGKGNEWETVDFPCKCLGPALNGNGESDIDPDDLASYRSRGKIEGLPNSIRFMFDKNDDVNFQKRLFALKQFLIDTLKCWSEDGTPLKQGLNNAVNAKFLGTIRRRPDRDNPEVMYDEIGKWAPVE